MSTPRGKWRPLFYIIMWKNASNCNPHCYVYVHTVKSMPTQKIYTTEVSLCICTTCICTTCLPVLFFTNVYVYYVSSSQCSLLVMPPPPPPLQVLWNRVRWPLPSSYQCFVMYMYYMYVPLVSQYYSLLMYMFTMCCPAV